MTYALRASAQSYNTTSTASITIPSAVQAGDLMILSVTGNNGGSTTPTGWNDLSGTTSSGGIVGKVYYRFALSTDPSSSVSITTAASITDVALFAAQGFVAAQPTEVLEAIAGGTFATGGASRAPTAAGELIVLHGYAPRTGSTWSVTSTNGTPTILSRDTTDTNDSDVLATIATNPSGSSTSVSFSFTPAGTNGYLVSTYRFTDLKLTGAAGGAGTVTFPLKVVGVTATSTTTASAATAVTSAAPSSIIATVTPDVTVSVDAATVTLDDAALILICDDAAEVSGLTQTGYIYLGGTKVGDDFNNPIVASGAGSQTFVVDFTAATVQDGEPNPTWDPPVVPGDPGTVLQATMWIRYTPLLNGTLTITGTTAADDYEIEIFYGDSLDSLARVDRSYFDASTGTAPSPLTYDATANTPTYLRVWATGTSWATSPYATHITLSFVQDASQQGDLVLDLLTPEFSTSPGVIRVNVIGGTPAADLAFDLLGTTATYTNPPGIALGSSVATYTADTSGNLYGATIPLPTVSAGTYTIRVRDTTAGTSVAGSIQVDADPITPPGTIGPDSPIGTVSNGTTVKSWTFKDPAPGGLGAYTFPINPATMTSPHAPRNVVLERTVAIDGHHVIWEAAYRANEWRFQGTVLTQAFYETLVDFTELNHRFWITDHRNRAWVASIESIDWTKRHALDNDWAWDYDITALIFQGPVTLP